jgi:hypothetical protein
MKSSNAMASVTSPSPTASVDLYWLPLGAGGHSVRWNGRVFEAIAARRAHRPVQELYHAALEVHLHDDLYVIEMAPVWSGQMASSDVVLEGPVGARWLGRSAMFRYAIRRWHGGVIPDVAEAVASPQRVSQDVGRSRMLLSLVQEVPALTWGRDEMGLGDMWNSNSVVAWLLDGSHHDMKRITPPEHGRAPGWSAGLALAGRAGPRLQVGEAEMVSPGDEPSISPSKSSAYWMR